MRADDEIDVLEMKVRGLEREVRELRAALRDEYFKAALAGLLAKGYGPTHMVVAEAWKIADESMTQRKETP